MKKVFLLNIALLGISFCPWGLQKTSAQPRLRADNIDEMVAAMTLEEKAYLLVGADDEVGEKGNHVPGAAGSTHAIPRLGIPPAVLSDGPAGVRISTHRDGTDQTFYGTGFPVGIALASTWNTELVEEVGRSIGNEALEYGVDVLLAPGMNIHRTPLCGRNFEYYSEDPVLSGRIAAAYVRGIQSQGVGTSVKHFVANSQETNRINVDEVISQRALREIYLRGFEIALHESDPWTVMSSYNKVNGTWTQSSRELLQTILRDEWGYRGLVMTDWTNERRPSHDRVAAGNALLMPGHKWQDEDIIAHVQDGSLPMAEVDARVREMLNLIVRTPRFRGYKYSDRPDLEAHAKVTRQTSTEGMVLLRNEKGKGKREKCALPLDSDVKRVALFGATSYDFIAGGTGSGNVNKPYVVDLRTGLENAGLQLSKELSDLYAAHKAQVLAERRARGNDDTGRIPELKVSADVIRRQAGQNDVAIVTISRQAGEGSDRRIDGDFNLTTDERDQIEAICCEFQKRGKSVVVILNMGNAIETASWRHLPDAILLAWQPGQEGGNSVADVLTGKQSPSGRLPMTFPTTLSSFPAALNFPTGAGNGSVRWTMDNGKWTFKNEKLESKGRWGVDYTIHEEGIYVGYRYFTTQDTEVSYPFGYGLSYTSFEYIAPCVRAIKDGFEASVTVRNTGCAASKEVVQLYVSAPRGTFSDKPVRELKAFAKTRILQPGESQVLTFSVAAADLASFSEAQSEWQTAAGTYDIQFAANANDIRAHATYKLSKPIIRKTNNVLKTNDAWKNPTGLPAV